MTNDEDSGSDWDSMSEMEPLPKKIIEKQHVSNHKEHRMNNDNYQKGQPAVVPRKLKSMTFVDPAVAVKKSHGENPPFDFKSESTNSPTQEEMPSKPGKPKKGKAYDPKDKGAQRRVSFVEEIPSEGKTMMNGNMVQAVSDSEDPLYSTIKRKLPISSNLSPIKDSQEESVHKNPIKSTSKLAKNSSKFSAKSLQGLENQGYVDDEEIPSRKHSQFIVSNENDTRSSPMESVLSVEAVPEVPSKSIVNIFAAEKSVDASSRAVGHLESDGAPPVILSLGQSSVEAATKKPMEAMNQILAEACNFVTFPLFCLALVLHHMLRFFLQGLVKPLLVDSLVLVVEYLFRPIMGLVVKPMLNSLHGASTAFSDIILVCLKPLIAVLQSFRLVEINYTRKYAIEEM